MNPQPHPLRCETCDHYNGGEYFDKCKNEIFPDNMDSTERQYIKDWISSHGCASHSAASRPAPSPAPIRSMREDEDGYISWQQMNERALEEHDAAIAAQAREDVLDELAKEIDRVSKTWHHACALHEIVKSLRHREVQE